MAIKITIEQSGSEKYKVRENVITKRTPTEITEREDRSYGGGSTNKVQYIEDFAVQEVEKVRNWTQELLRQEIQDESKFDLAAVIKAINNL